MVMSSKMSELIIVNGDGEALACGCFMLDQVVVYT